MMTLRALLLTAVLAAPITAFANEPAALAAPDPREFEELAAKIDAAITSLQVGNFFGFFEDSPGFAYVFNAKTYSFAEIRDLHVKSWAAQSRAVVHSKLVAFVRPAPNLATITTAGHIEFTAKTGMKRSFTFALTLSLIKRADGWRALQIHESTLPDPVPAPSASNQPHPR